MNKPQEFILCDGANLFHRAIHMTNPAQGIDSQIGMALHLIMYSLKKEWNTFEGSHAVFFIEGHSWRKNFYPLYKADRAVKYAAKTQKEKDDQTVLTEAFDDLVKLLVEKSNITVLRNPKAEADDMIAMWIDMHPNDNHTLISSDSDFYQLLAPNVRIYDPVKDILITHESVTNDAGKNMSFILNGGKLSALKPSLTFKPAERWWDYALFLKIVRGDATDNVMSAYPGVREKGTKNKVGIIEAYEDRNNKGFAYTNFMMQNWTDHEGNENKVKDIFERNRILIDLSAMPDNVKDECKSLIQEQISKKNVPALDIGMGFMKFCGRWDLQKISNNSQQFMPLFTAQYKRGQDVSG